MIPVSLSAQLLRLQVPDLVLRPGMSVVARVASRGDGASAALVLAGALIKATVPEGVRAGDTLRLTVAQTDAERIVLKLEGSTPGPNAPKEAAASAPTASQPAAAAPAVGPNAAAALGLGGPLPLQANATDPDEAGDGARSRGSGIASVSLVYETPALGRMDLHIDRGPDGVVATIGARAGIAGLAEERVAALQAALEAKLGVPATVRIAPRRDQIDAYA